MLEVAPIKDLDGSRSSCIGVAHNGFVPGLANAGRLGAHCCYLAHTSFG